MTMPPMDVEEYKRIFQQRVEEGERKAARVKQRIAEMAQFIRDNEDIFGPIRDANLTEDSLTIGERKYPTIYFHKPEEPHGYLSNWYLSDFELDGKKFSSVEQYIMYRKCKLFGDEESAAAVMATQNPAEQQAIARNAKGYNDLVWKGIRQTVAVQGLLEKFRQNKELWNQLKNTGGCYLVECAVSDRAWACGVSLYDDARCNIDTWKGTNILGFALMNVRETLRREEKSDAGWQANVRALEESVERLKEKLRQAEWKLEQPRSVEISRLIEQQNRLEEERRRMESRQRIQDVFQQARERELAVQRRAEEQRRIEEAQRMEELRQAKEREYRLAEQRRAEEERRLAEEHRLEEQQRIEEERLIEQRRMEQRRLALIQNNRCQYCGGAFTGLFSKKCSACGKPKDYE